MFFPLKVGRWHRNSSCIGPLRAVFADVHQPVGIGEGERTEQNRVEGAEDRAGGPDAERQRKHDDRCERGALAQRANRVPEIAQQGSDPVVACSYPGNAGLGGDALSANRCEVAETTPGFALCLLRPQPVIDQLPRLHLQVHLQLGIHVLPHLGSGTLEESPESRRQGHPTPPSRPARRRPPQPTAPTAPCLPGASFHRTV